MMRKAPKITDKLVKGLVTRGIKAEEFTISGIR